jgi:hypothetical protein
MPERKMPEVRIWVRATLSAFSIVSCLQRYAPIKIIGIKIIVPIKSEKSLSLMVHISKTLTKPLR